MWGNICIQHTPTWDPAAEVTEGCGDGLREELVTQ